MAKHISKLLILMAVVIIIATAYYLQMNKVEGFADSGISPFLLVGLCIANAAGGVLLGRYAIPSCAAQF